MRICSGLRAAGRGRQQVALLLAATLGFMTLALAAKPDRLFDAESVQRLSIVISSEAMEALQREPKKPVAAMVLASGRTFTNVALHLKGLGSFQPITEKPSFSIKFDTNGSGARFLGHSRILLENSSQDPAFLCRRLCSEIFLRAGIPAARVTWATVRLNGRDLGLYTLSEAMNKQFLRRHFTSAEGKLYEGSDFDITENLEQDSGPPGRAEVQALIAACEEADPTRRWRLLNARLDVDRFITYAALEVLVCHHDGYSLDLNNYRLYCDPTTQRFVFIPHGMDLVFDRPTLSLDPEWKGLVARAVMGTTDGRRVYRQRVSELAQQVFANDRLVKRIDALSPLLARSLEPFGAADLAQFNASISSLKSRIKERARFLLDAQR